MAVAFVHKPVPMWYSSSSSLSLGPLRKARRRRRQCREQSRLITSSCLECMRLKQQQRRALQPRQSVPHKTRAEQEEPAVDKDRAHQENVGVRIALSMLGFYKTAISPILPPSCRFVPTCSSYAMEAYSEYGVGKGTIMTAWRLMRCTPWGNSGYDPAVWPPPGLGWMSSLF